MPKQALIPADYRISDDSTRTFSAGIATPAGIWLSGSTAGRADAATGRIRVEGDLVAQARVVLEKMRVVLRAGELNLGDIAAMVQYVPPVALGDLSKLYALYGEVFSGAIPVVNTIVVKSLLRPAALIEIEAVAPHREKGGFEYLAASGADLAQARARASAVLAARGLGWKDVARTTELVTTTAFGSADAVVAGGSSLQVVMPRVVEAGAGAQVQMTISRSGDRRVIFLAAAGDPRSGGVEAQCRDIYARLGNLLGAAGSGLNDIVKTTEFVTPAGLGAYRRTAAVRREVFTAPYPAATGVVCERLMQAGAEIAIEIVAVQERS